jgi:hypothetical protein
MTSCAIIAGMLPMSAGIGEGRADFDQRLAGPPYEQTSPNRRNRSTSVGTQERETSEGDRSERVGVEATT